MIKKLFLLAILFAFANLSNAQTADELKAQKSEKDAQIAKLQGESDAIAAKIAALPGWKYGAFGTVGLNLSQFNNWLGRAKANTSSTNIGISFNAFANNQQDKYFWRNSLGLNLGWLKFDDKDDNSFNQDLEQTADAINLISLFGYKLSEKLAISAMGEYRSTILSNFNNPGYFDIGAGITWTPIPAMVVVVHPLNYNFVFSSGDLEYTSSLGAKVLVNYAKQLPLGVAWTSKLSAFLSYSDPNNLSNWTWVNGVAFKAFKSIGIGFEFGLRANKQEALNYKKFTGPDPKKLDPSVTFETLRKVDNPLQSYWILGLTYGF